jgi:hypothetical protein
VISTQKNRGIEEIFRATWPTNLGIEVSHGKLHNEHADNPPTNIIILGFNQHPSFNVHREMLIDWSNPHAAAAAAHWHSIHLAVGVKIPIARNL